MVVANTALLLQVSRPQPDSHHTLTPYTHNSRVPPQTDTHKAKKNTSIPQQTTNEDPGDSAHTTMRQLLLLSQALLRALQGFYRLLRATDTFKFEKFK